MNKFVLLAFLVLGGCATPPPKDITGPDGLPHKLLTCGGIEKCYEIASKTCGKYKIVNTSNDVSTDAAGDTHGVNKMLIKCE